MFSANADKYERALQDFKANGGRMAPRGINTRTGAVIFRETANHETAMLSWRMIESDLPEMRQSALDAQREADEAMAAYERPWFANIPGNLVPGAGVMLILMAFAFSLHLVVFSARRVVLKLRGTARARRALHVSSVFKGAQEGRGIGIVELPANWHSVGQASDSDADGFEELRQI